MDSNHRPHAYQACALTTWAMSPQMVEMRRLELLTPCVQGRCSPSWATPPCVSLVYLYSLFRRTCLQYCEATCRNSCNEFQDRKHLCFLFGPSKLNNMSSEKSFLTYTKSRFSVSLETSEYNLPAVFVTPLERRWSSRTFRYGYLVTTSPQLSVLPSAASSIKVRLPTSGPPDSHGVTGGVYKARERIHRGMLIRDY